MSADFNLNPHPLYCQLRHPNSRHNRLVRSMLLQHALNRLLHFLTRSQIEQADAIDILPPSSSAGNLQCVLDVVKGLFDFFAEVGVDLMGFAVPAACDVLVWIR